MKNMKKIVLFLVILLMSIAFIPTFASADSHPVSTEDELKKAIEDANSGDTIELTADIKLKTPIEITKNDITIDGKNFTISREETWQLGGPGNQSLMTVGSGRTVTFKDISFKDSAKYGLQAYNTGHIIVDNVTVANNHFGGIIVNGGTLEIKKLHLEKNGATDNNGIEISKGDSLETDVTPTIIMNGTLTSTQDKNVIYIAENDKNLTTFDVKNDPNSEYKILVDDNKVVITDANNKVLFESNENEKVTSKGEEYVKDIIVTVKLNDKAITKELKEGETLSREDLEKEIDTAGLDLAKYNILGYYEDADFEKEFDFTKALTEDTFIYAKLEEKKVEENPKDEDPRDEDPKVDDDKKDETPKTGVVNAFPIVLSGIAISTAVVLIVKKKDLF